MSPGTQGAAEESVSVEETERNDAIEILYVEDDPGFADLGVTCLEDTDVHLDITTAPDAARGLELLSDDIDCIVSDYNMPGMNGIEFLDTVRETYPDLPFILFTAKGPETFAGDTFATDVTEYLQKGGGVDQFTTLATRIKHAVENRHAGQSLAGKIERLDTLSDCASPTLFATAAGPMAAHGGRPNWPSIEIVPDATPGDSVLPASTIETLSSTGASAGSTHSMDTELTEPCREK